MTDVKVVMRQAKSDGALIDPATEAGQKRHELHAAAQPVVEVATSVGAIADLLTAAGFTGGVPSWVTACRLYVGSAGRIAYSTDGTAPAFSAGNVTHGAALDEYYTGHLITGNANVAALKLIAETAETKVTIELIG
ncbi:hypothetical protein [Pleomorphomonas oryzae]|uniref:hypothetical protein n=1 Tax=Pleomorphomonas oryzae TaxID=261934 RepID=UPI0003FB1D35|nr:hypothetical protein [Pleomorphomonas oryzae]